MPNSAIAYWNATADAYAQRVRIRTDDFHYGPLIPGEGALRLLPAMTPGRSALELGCGGAANSIYLTRHRQLRCTALDGAPRLLLQARAQCREARADVALIEADLDRLTEDLPGYDLIHSVHALQFVDDPGGLIGWAAAHLNPGGTLLIATHHPLFAGEWLELEDGEMGLFLPDYFVPPADIRDTDESCIASRTYPIGQWLDWLRGAGLSLTRLAEPRLGETPADAPYVSDDWLALTDQLHHIPATLILVARRREG